MADFAPLKTPAPLRIDVSKLGRLKVPSRKGSKVAVPKPAATAYGFKLDKHGHFNGKPLSHWRALADENVMIDIVQAIKPDPHSIVATIASERLTHLAQALDPELYAKVLAKREAWQSGLAGVVADILTSNMAAFTDGTPLCPKHAREQAKLLRGALAKAKRAKARTKR